MVVVFVLSCGKDHTNKEGVAVSTIGEKISMAKKEIVEYVQTLKERKMRKDSFPTIILTRIAEKHLLGAEEVLDIFDEAWAS